MYHISTIYIATRRDLRTLTKNWVEKLQIGPWHLRTFTKKDAALLTGADRTPETGAFTVIAAETSIRNRRICILQAAGGPSPIDFFLNSHGEGILGIGIEMAPAELNSAVQKWSTQGLTSTAAFTSQDWKLLFFDTRRRLGTNLVLESGFLPKADMLFPSDDTTTLQQHSLSIENPQIGLTLRGDMRELFQNWVSLMNISPWGSFCFGPERSGHFYMDDKLDPQPFFEKIGCAMADDLELEIIENKSGKCSVYPYLQTHEIGAQHIKFKCADGAFISTMEDWKQRGLRRGVWGYISHACFANFNTLLELGCDIELGNVTALDVSAWDFESYPPLAELP